MRASAERIVEHGDVAGHGPLPSSAIEWKRLLKISSSMGLALSIQHSVFSQETNYKEHRLEKENI